MRKISVNEQLTFPCFDRPDKMLVWDKPEQWTTSAACQVDDTFKELN